mmetsp:Transcript_52793/g.104781  ORF Transcript_52793/g.104781 Transcript_52793/m.104781 type:complete len:446 (+) Transcript_52793:36-1373(+)
MASSPAARSASLNRSSTSRVAERVNRKSQGEGPSDGSRSRTRPISTSTPRAQPLPVSPIRAASAHSGVGTGTANRSVDFVASDALSPMQYKRLVEKAAADETRRAKREERAASVARAKEINADARRQQLDAFQEYAKQSSKKQESNKTRESTERGQKKLQSEYRAENWARMRQQRNRTDLEADRLENNKIQSDLHAHTKAERVRLAKEQKHEMAKLKLEGFRQTKRQESLEDESQKDALENAKIQHDINKHLRAEREKYEKELRHEMAQIKADAFKNNKAQRSLEDLSQKAQLENAKIQYEQLAYSRARRNSTEREQRREVNRIKAESLRQDATEKRAKHRAQQGTIQKETFDADDIQPETLNQLLTSAGLKQYLTVLDSKGCTSPEDLGKLSRKEVELMVPSKMIHRRKLLLLTQHYRPSVNTQYHSGLSQRIRGNDSSLGTAL